MTISLTTTPGGIQEMLCIRLIKLNGWLFSVNPEKISPQLRDTVVMYQDECFAVLYDYWYKGAAVNPRHEHRQTTVALLASEAESAKRLAGILKIGDTRVVPFINAVIREIYDTDCLRLAEQAEQTEQTEIQLTGLTGPVSGKKVWLTTTQLGKRLSLTPHKTNKLLQEQGIIEPFRNRKGQLHWKPTARGKPYITGKGAKRNPGNYDGVHQLLFSESVIDLIIHCEND